MPHQHSALPTKHSPLSLPHLLTHLLHSLRDCSLQTSPLQDQSPSNRHTPFFLPVSGKCVGGCSWYSAEPSFALTNNCSHKCWCREKCVQSCIHKIRGDPHLTPHLRLNVQDGNFILLVDLMHSFKFGAKHVSLVTAKLQKLIGRNVLGHLLRGDKVIVLPFHLILLLGACGVWKRRELVSDLCPWGGWRTPLSEPKGPTTLGTNATRQHEGHKEGPWRQLVSTAP